MGCNAAAASRLILRIEAIATTVAIAIGWIVSMWTLTPGAITIIALIAGAVLE
jgi:hypothetical protein